MTKWIEVGVASEDGWEIIARQLGADSGSRHIIARKGGREIGLNAQYRRVCEAGAWRDPSEAELALIACAIPLHAQLDAEIAARHQPAPTCAERGCSAHPERPAEHYSPVGERICAECYARG